MQIGLIFCLTINFRVKSQNNKYRIAGIRGNHSDLSTLVQQNECQDADHPVAYAAIVHAKMNVIIPAYQRSIT